MNRSSVQCVSSSVTNCLPTEFLSQAWKQWEDSAGTLCQRRGKSEGKTLKDKNKTIQRRRHVQKKKQNTADKREMIPKTKWD